MRYLKPLMPAIILLSMGQPALAATPVNLAGDLMSVVPVSLYENLVVLVLGLIGLTVIARR